MFFQNIFWNLKHVINQFKQRRNYFAPWLYLCNVLLKFLINIESTCICNVKEVTPQLTLLYCTVAGLSEATTRGVLLKISQYPQETLVLESLLKKAADLKVCIFIKKRPRHRCFPVNIAKFLRLPILKNISERLPFDCFNGSLLHGPQASG